MTTFFTSDTHFNHANIINLGDGRPFNDIDHHNTALIDNWNSVVTPDDTVIHLGDVALGPWPDGLMMLKRCHGYKVLVPGNHDRISSLESEKRRERFLPDYEEVFDEIWGEVAIFSFDGSDERTVVLSHYPYDGDSHEKDRHAKLRATDFGNPLVHGHTHALETRSVSAKGTPMLSVGVDANNWTPVHEDVVIAWLDSL